MYKKKIKFKKEFQNYYQGIVPVGTPLNYENINNTHIHCIIKAKEKWMK